MRTTCENNTLTIYLEGRIDSNNAAENDKEIAEAVAANTDAHLAIDAEHLEYISSAGLRVLMKLRKSAGKPLPVLNVSSEVYEIFDVTGFTEMLDVKKKLREVSVEGCECIGQGATASVYRIDRETIVKVFKPNAGMEIIRQENERSKNAFLSGIPTAISYDTVKVGDCFGTVFELLDARDFLSVLENDKAHLDDHISLFAKAMHRMHQIEVDPAKFPPTKQGSLAVLPRLAGVCGEEEIGKLRRLYESVPDRSTFIHGDSHPGNVMVQDGQFLFIDLMTCGSGHPVFDLASMCSAYHMPPKFGDRKMSPLLRYFTEEECARIWKVYLASYLETENKDLIERAEKQITAVSAARTLFATVFLPGLLPADRIEQLKRTALAYVDGGLEPLCF